MILTVVCFHVIKHPWAVARDGIDRRVGLVTNGRRHTIPTQISCEIRGAQVWTTGWSTPVLVARGEALHPTPTNWSIHETLPTNQGNQKVNQDETATRACTRYATDLVCARITAPITRFAFIIICVCIIIIGIPRGIGLGWLELPQLDGWLELP
jgi:hypothetical protein